MRLTDHENIKEYVRILAIPKCQSRSVTMLRAKNQQKLVICRDGSKLFLPTHIKY